MKFNKHFKVATKIISENTPVFIIAEAGVNHNGDINKAKELIDVAASAGVDAVKFQAFKTENLILKNVDKAPYQQKTTDSKESQFEMLKSLEINQNQPSALNNHGVFLQRLNRNEEALVSFDRAIDYQPEYAEAHANKANSLSLLKNF